MGLAADRSRGPRDRDALLGGPAPRPGSALASSTCNLALPAAGLARRPSAGSGEDPGVPRGREGPGTPRGRGATPPTHVALQLPLGGRLDQPTRADGVSRAHGACLPSSSASARGGGSRWGCRRGGPSASRPIAGPAPPPPPRRPRDPRPGGGGGRHHPAPGSPAQRARAGPPTANFAPRPPLPPLSAA